jgi:membrane-anchored mycosin MYCP
VAPLAAVALLAAATAVGPGVALTPARAGSDTCDNTRMGLPPSADVPWAQERLEFERVHRFATGAGITVAVVDSGLDQENPQSREIRTVSPRNVLPGYRPDDIRDCVDVGHGTGVSSIIAAPRLPGIGFEGLAPEVTIMPIKFSDPDDPDLSDADTVAAGIEAAVAAGADVVNLSLTTLSGTPRLREAVLAAKRRDIVVVAATGNEGADDNRPGFPAQYAADPETFSNLIAVTAVDQADQVAEFSTTGEFAGIAAPGADIMMPNPKAGYTVNEGTSFAAPFVSATAALVRQRYPGLEAAEVVDRLEATADRPGVSVPDEGYGYGILNPYLAVTVERVASGRASTPQRLPAVPAPDLPQPPDRTLQNVAYGVAGGMLVLTAVLGVGTAAWRRTASERGPSSPPHHRRAG